LELSCAVTRQVAEVYTSLAAVDPWLWLRERVKLAELARAELVRTGLAWAEFARTELAWMGLAWAELARTGLARTELV